MTPHVDIGDLVEPRLERPSRRRAPLLIGFARDADNGMPDTPECRAFLAAGGTMVAAQQRDPASAGDFTAFHAAWRRLNRQAGTWWRVEHSDSNLPPLPTRADFDVPNPEYPHETARIPELLEHEPWGVFVLGKVPGVPVDLLNRSGVHLICEAFKESDRSDTTVANCIRFWRDAGLRDELLVVALDAAEPTFAPLGDQARQAVALGIRQLAIYPLDGADPAGVRAVGKALGTGS